MGNEPKTSLMEEVESLIGSVPEFGAFPEIDTLSRPLWEADERFLNPFADIPPVQTWAMMGERPAIPRQGIITFSSKPKQGKSLSVYALLLPILKGEALGVVKPDGERPRLAVVFDTEMDVPTLAERYKSLQSQLGGDYVRFMVVPLLEVQKSQRLKVIEEVTAQYSPDIVAIDQVARLVNDFNASAESVELGEVLATFAAQRTLFVVIHQNKAADNSQMKGHLGSIMEELAVENYSVSHNKGVYEVKPINSRRSRIDDDSPSFLFALREDGAIVTADEILEGRQADEREQWRKNFAQIFGSDETLTHSEMVKRIGDKEKLCPRAARIKIESATRSGAIAKVGSERRAPYRLTSEDGDFADIPYDDDEEL